MNKTTKLTPIKRRLMNGRDGSAAFSLLQHPDEDEHNSENALRYPGATTSRAIQLPNVEDRLVRKDSSTQWPSGHSRLCPTVNMLTKGALGDRSEGKKIFPGLSRQYSGGRVNGRLQSRKNISKRSAQRASDRSKQQAAGHT